jgi:hypothetical protein
VFRRIILELARVFVPPGRKPDFPPVSEQRRLDVLSIDFDEVTIDSESGQSRLRDCAAMRPARSRRRVWRAREARHIARLSLSTALYYHANVKRNSEFAAQWSE